MQRPPLAVHEWDDTVLTGFAALILQQEHGRSRTPSGSTPTPVNRKDRALTGEQADCSGPCTVKSSYLQWQNTKQNISSQP